MASSKKWLKISLISLGAILIILGIGITFFLADYVKGKLITAVDNNTDYHLHIGSLKFKGLTSVALHGVELIPKVSKADFNKSITYQKDWISIENTNIIIEAIDWMLFYKTNQFRAEKVVIEEPYIYACRDRNPSQPPYEYKPLPAEQLRHIKQVFTIPLIEIKNGKITYEEITKKENKSGKVTFSALYGSIYHLSSDSSYREKEPSVIVEGKAKILDSISAEITYKFNPAYDKSTFEAKVKSFEAPVLNQCLNPLTNTEIASGHVNGIHLKFDASNTHASGFLDMDYKDLKIKVLSKDENKHPSKLKTIVANLLIHKENTPANDPSDKSSHGEIEFDRRKDRYIFNYWWNAVKSGVQSSITKIDIPAKTKK